MIKNELGRSSLKMGLFRNLVSFQNISIAVFLAYMTMVSQTFYGILYPTNNLRYVNEHGKEFATIKPMWEQGSRFDVRIYLSPRERVTAFSSKDMVEIWKFDQVEFSEDGSVDVHLNLTEELVTPSIWTMLAKNQTLFVNFQLKPKRHQEIWTSSALVKFIREDPKPVKRYLVKDWPILGPLVPREEPEKLGTPASKRHANMIGYWKPIASAHLVADWTHWPYGGSGTNTPRTVLQYLSVDRKTMTYRPVPYTDQLGLTKEKLIQINTTNDVLPLHLHIGPISLARWQFNAHMEETLKIQEQFGASEKDIDDLRYMLTETDPILLAVTMLVSMVHILLDVLAFKSDISFWSNAKSTKGLSVKTMATDLVSQIIITAYLHEQAASLLVLAPSAVGVFIQVWKLRRAFSLGSSQVTTSLDSAATNKLMILIIPIVIGYSLYSLIYQKHAGFYSWAIGSLASCVYALGFVMMTPQIFINYKLKSVAHLPWNFFIYKALNTFIDDLFAFIIRMPMMTRLATVRDDIIFIVFMYQRYIYPVDRTRKHEFQEDDDEQDEHNNKKNK